MISFRNICRIVATGLALVADVVISTALCLEAPTRGTGSKSRQAPRNVSEGAGRHELHGTWSSPVGDRVGFYLGNFSRILKQDLKSVLKAILRSMGSLLSSWQRLLPTDVSLVTFHPEQ